MLDGQIFDENKPSLDVFLKKNCRFTKKMQKWREKVDSVISHFGIEGIQIRMKNHGKTVYINICTKKN